MHPFAAQSDTRPRYWRRTDPPTPWALAWRGLLPIVVALALVVGYGLTGFARVRVEQTVARQSRAALDGRGLSWAVVAVSGQSVTLSGTAPDPRASEQALEAVRSARCPTWTGLRLCAVSVQGQFQQQVRWPDLRASLQGGVLTLEGTVPNEAAQVALAARAQLLKSPPRIVQVRDSLVVSGSPAPQAWAGLARRVVDVAGGCLRASASLRGGLFSVTGEATSASLGALRAQANAPAEGARIGPVDLFAAEAVSACESALRKLLETSPIEFEGTGAILAQSTSALLDRVAAAAASCPGALRIEGHIEAAGAPESNLELGNARAGAVRAALVKRGLDPAHLLAEGRAEPLPASPHLDPSGRTRSHHIEIHVAVAP